MIFWVQVYMLLLKLEFYFLKLFFKLQIEPFAKLLLCLLWTFGSCMVHEENGINLYLYMKIPSILFFSFFGSFKLVTERSPRTNIGLILWFNCKEKGVEHNKAFSFYEVKKIYFVTIRFSSASNPTFSHIFFSYYYYYYLEFVVKLK